LRRLEGGEHLQDGKSGSNGRKREKRKRKKDLTGQRTCEET
jgi:hypothetical protein